MTGYDYDNQAWYVDGKYVACGHTGACDCYGTAHEGQAVPQEIAGEANA
jgi:hypothetical protein